MKMKMNIDINKKVLAIIVVVVVIAAVAVAYTQGYISFGKQSPFKSEREASGAITNISSGVDQISSIIEDIDKKLGK